jgi:putative flippase GtrA
MSLAADLHALAKHFFRFALVGVCGTGAHYGVLWVLVERVGIPVLAATSVGFIAGALVNYSLNRRFTFASDASHVEALPKFLAIVAVGAIFNWLIVAWLLPRWQVHYLLIQLLATGTVLLWNFIGNYLWTFRKQKLVH